MAGYGRDGEGGSSNGQSVHRSSSRESSGEIMAEEVYS